MTDSCSLVLIEDVEACWLAVEITAEVVISAPVLPVKVVDREVVSVVIRLSVVKVSPAADAVVEASSLVVVDICSLEVAVETCVSVVLAEAWSVVPVCSLVAVVEICSVEDGCSPVLAEVDETSSPYVEVDVGSLDVTVAMVEACSLVLAEDAELIVLLLSDTQVDPST